MARHEKMASWDRQRTRKELRNFIEQYMHLLRDLDSTFNQKGRK